MSSLLASIKRIGSKTTKKRRRHCFPHYKSIGAFCCHGNQSFDPICPKTLCSLSPTPVMLHIKFDQDWPTGFRDIQVWKCGWQMTTDNWYTISSPCEPSAQVSYKTNKVTMRPAKTQISLGICQVWSASSPSPWRNLGSLATHQVHSEDSDQTGWMPRLIWVLARHTVILLVLSCRGSQLSRGFAVFLPEWFPRL